MIVIIFALYVGYATSNLTTSQLDSAITGLDTLPGKAVGTWGPCERRGGAAGPGLAGPVGLSWGAPPAPASARCWPRCRGRDPNSTSPHQPPLTASARPARPLPHATHADSEKLQKYGVASTTYPWNNKQDEQVGCTAWRAPKGAPRAGAGAAAGGGSSARLRHHRCGTRQWQTHRLLIAAAPPPALLIQAMVADVKSGALQVGRGRVERQLAAARVQRVGWLRALLQHRCRPADTC